MIIKALTFWLFLVILLRIGINVHYYFCGKGWDKNYFKESHSWVAGLYYFLLHGGILLIAILSVVALGHWWFKGTFV